MIDFLMDIAQYALIILGVVFVIIAVASSMEYVYRWAVLRIKSLLNSGYRVWRISPDGRMSRSQTSPEDFRKATRAILSELSVGSRSIIRPRRATASFVVRNAPQEESGGTELFLIIDRFHADERAVKRWANGVNCQATELDDVPEIIGRRSSMAFHESYQPAKITDDVTTSDIGSVIAGMQSQSDYKSIPGVVIMTIEGMQNAEARLFSNAAVSAYREPGEHNGFDRVKVQMDTFSADPQRASFAAMADSGNAGDSFDLMKSALSNVQSSPMDHVATDPLRNYVMSWEPIKMLLLSIPGFAGLYLFDNNIFWFFALTPIILGVLRCTPLLSTWFIDSDTRRGLVAMPPFFRLGPWRLIKRMLGYKKVRNADGVVVSKINRASPAPKTIIPMYPTSVVEFSTMPQDMKTSNSVKSDAPVIGFPTRLEKLYEDPLAMSFNGFSSAGQTFGRRIETLQWGSCWGGGSGSGKTNGLMLDYYNVARINASSTGASQNYQITPIWLETKSEGAYDLQELVKDFDPIFIDAHDPNGKYRLAIDGKRVDPYDKKGNDTAYSYAVDFTNSLVQALGARSVGPRASDIIRNVHFLAVRLTNSELEFLGLGKAVSKNSAPNLVNLDYYLAGGDPGIMPFDKMKKLSEQFTDKSMQDRKKAKKLLSEGHKKDESEELDKVLASIARQEQCAERMNSLAGLNDRSPEAFGAVTNKLNSMRMSDGMFKPMKDRVDITIDEIISSFRPVIINMGGVLVGTTPEGGRSFDAPPVGDKAAKELLAAFHYLLWTRIKKRCSGWLEQNKYVSIYADEVSDIVSFDPDSDNIIMEVRDQGRSKGCSHNIGFQTFQQMPDETANSILSFPTRYFMTFDGQEDIKRVLESFGDSSTNYTNDMISNWGVGVGVARITTMPNEYSGHFVFRTPHAGTFARRVDEFGGDVASAITETADDMFDD